MADKKLEDMNQEEKVNYLKRAVKKWNIASFFEEVEWSLREPKCPCDFCDSIYQGWLDEGKELYKDDMNAYEKRAREANIHREEGKLSRKLDNKKYTRSDLQRALVFN